jgi:SAM-dependent methyltransferase
MDIANIARLAEKPLAFATGEKLWDDPYIATQMLEAHLDPSTDAASRRPETIDRQVNWIVDRLRLQSMADLLDLGCGPGLYDERFARRGLNVTGFDLSENSLRYAKDHAHKEGLRIDYRLQNYLEMSERDRFDAAVLIYFDLGPLSNPNRDTLLANVWRALKPGGRFVFDVLTVFNRPRELPAPSWHIHPHGGFFRPGPYLELFQVFQYPDEDLFLNQYIILEDGGKASVYRNWEHYYTPAAITAILARAGFAVDEIRGDLEGNSYQEGGPSLAVIARKI